MGLHGMEHVVHRGEQFFRRPGVSAAACDFLDQTLLSRDTLPGIGDICVSFCEHLPLVHGGITRSAPRRSDIAGALLKRRRDAAYHMICPR
jgi:hypothetical protein